MSSTAEYSVKTGSGTRESSAILPLAFQKRGRVPFGLVQPAVITADIAIILLASIIAGVGYHRLVLDATGDTDTFLAFGLLLSANFVAITSAQRNYAPTNLVNVYRQLRYLTLSWWAVCLIVLTAAFALKISGQFSRGSTLTFFVLGWLSLSLERVFIGRKIAGALSAGTFAKKKVVVIAERGLQASSRALHELRKCGYDPVSIVELSVSEFGLAKGLRLKLKEIITTCQEKPVEHVFLLLEWNRQRLIQQLLETLRVLAIPVHLLPDEPTSQLLSTRAAELGTVRTVQLQRAPLNVWEQALKRIVDIVGAGTLMMLLSPLLIMAAALIKLDSNGPILFKQKRNGFNGRTFVIYKFRTMHVLEDGSTIVQAKRNDPRVTRLGRFLRRSSIDELPQLLNVMLGSMSLVGPRPHAIAHNTEYQESVANYAFRHHMKPGITGWAQVNGLRGETRTTDAMARRVELDLYYINSWTPWLDLRILLKTALATYRQPMAY